MVQILRHDHHQRIQFATVDHRPVVGVDLGYVVLLGQSLGATPIATTYCAYAARMRAQSRKVEVGDMPEDLHHPMVMAGVEAALRTERTSMGFAPGAELSVLRRRS